MRSRWSWRGGWLLCVASEAAGADESGSKLARTPLAGARGEQGGVSSAALAEELGRGRWRQFEVVEAEMAVGARAATTEEAAAGLMASMTAAVRRRRPRGGRTARRRCGCTCGQERWRWGGGLFHSIRRFFFRASSRESKASAFPLRGRKEVFFRASDSNHKSVYSDPPSVRPTLTASGTERKPDPRASEPSRPSPWPCAAPASAPE
jgi:hypothetical protein